MGFLDHMLDLLARHGRLDLSVAVEGDLDTGSHHTVEDSGIFFGQALDAALGDRAGIARYGHAIVPMDEALATCAIDISGRPYCAFTADLPPGTIAGFDQQETEVLPRRGLGGQAHASPARRCRDERPPHDRGRVQGLRAALRAATALDPTETGVPSTKGTLT